MDIFFLLLILTNHLNILFTSSVGRGCFSGAAALVAGGRVSGRQGGGVTSAAWQKRKMQMRCIEVAPSIVVIDIPVLFTIIRLIQLLLLLLNISTTVQH